MARRGAQGAPGSQCSHGDPASLPQTAARAPKQPAIALSSTGPPGIAEGIAMLDQVHAATSARLGSVQAE